jgi:hypothetical protein
MTRVHAKLAIMVVVGSLLFLTAHNRTGCSAIQS